METIIIQILEEEVEIRCKDLYMTHSLLSELQTITLPSFEIEYMLDVEEDEEVDEEILRREVKEYIERNYPEMGRVFILDKLEEGEHYEIKNI